MRLVSVSGLCASISDATAELETGRVGPVVVSIAGVVIRTVALEGTATISVGLAGTITATEKLQGIAGINALRGETEYVTTILGKAA